MFFILNLSFISDVLISDWKDINLTDLSGSEDL